MFETLEATVPHLPRAQPRYLMGVGKPDDIVGAVLRGIDMFDCVLPTRSGRRCNWSGSHCARRAEPQKMFVLPKTRARWRFIVAAPPAANSPGPICIMW